MRLDRLEIIGFGGLRDQVIEFNSGLTIVLGDNESGKSTVHRAVRAALYGVDVGGPGRSIERSDWVRWQPWGGGTYGLALTYALESGRRYRVARRLDERAPKVQVMEIGGGDITDKLRVSRAVLPGLVHLGIDEAVFCATACLIEDGLRIDAADAATRRVPELQQAIERLADSGNGVTATQAVQRLRDAAQRIGSERRGNSPLGAAAARAAQLDVEIDSVRRRTQSLSVEQQRGRRLEHAATLANRRRIDSECAWLAGRLATLTSQRSQMETASIEARRLEEVASGQQRFADFRIDDEDQVIALGGEMAQAATVALEAESRRKSAQQRFTEVNRRRTEAAAGMRALAGTPVVSDAQLADVERLGTELTAEAGTDRHRDAADDAESRCGALRKEIAATGLGSVPIGSGAPVAAHVAAHVATLADAASGTRRRNRFASIAGAVGCAGAVLAGICFASGRARLALSIGGAMFATTAGLLTAGRVNRGPAAIALRSLRRLAPGLDTSEAGLERIARRLPTLQRLHTELQRQEVLADAGRLELANRRVRITACVNECQALARTVGVASGSPAARGAATGSTDELLAHGRSSLAAVTEAAARGVRRRELRDEDQRLILEERGLEQVIDDCTRRAEELGAVEARLGGLLAHAGIPPGEDPASAVSEYRQGCASRRTYETARREIQDLRRRVAAVGSDIPTLQGTIERLEENLRQRGGDPGDAAHAAPLDPAQLQLLEADADRAKHAAAAAMTEAAQLRARIAGLRDGMPSLADLDDERAACTQARNRALHQRAALDKACSVIDAATRGVHLAVAPRLSESIGKRLSMLTQARYDAVNVDTERFAISLQSHERPELVPLEMTSHGTRDQVSLLLRLALAEVFGDAGEPVPLLLDEPLLTADPQRRRRAVDFIARLAHENQIVITTSDPQFAAQLSAADADATIVTLGEPSLPLTGRAEPGRQVPRLSVVD